jgi:nitrate reductase gamma subunit
MEDAYRFVSGPLAWIAFILFFGGCLWRLIQILVLVHRKEKFIFTYMSLTYSLRSIAHWIVPFGTVNWRLRPVLTVVTFAFHWCLLATPVLLLSHVVIWEKAWNISWWTFPEGLADIMTVVVILSCVYFLVRRIVSPEVRYVTDYSDFVLLAVVAAPFVTGFLAFHQWFGYEFMVIAHIVCGEIMLAAIPFTRLSHMIYAPLTRAYIGSEFGKIRHAKDW